MFSKAGDDARLSSHTSIDEVDVKNRWDFWVVFIREGLREKEHDALLRARRPPMTFTGLLIFRFPAGATLCPSPVL